MPDIDNERETLVREALLEIPEGDGRTLEARIVPYSVKARVADPPDYRPYDEEWLPGAFERQTRAPDRIKVWLNFEHDPSLRGIVGHGIALEERQDGLYGTFRVHENADGDKALQMVRDGLLTGISLEAVAQRSRRVNGVVQRLRAYLDRVALVRVGAFSDAQVLALREEPPPDDDEPEPVPDDGEPVPAKTIKASQKLTWETAKDLEKKWLDATAHIPPPSTTLEEDIAELAADLEKVEPVTLQMRERVVEELDREERVKRALERIGYEPLIARAVVRTPWDGSAARFEDDEWRRSCVLDRGGDGPPKSRYGFPVLEPDGNLNINGLHAAAARLNQANATPAQKSAAARKLLRYYRQAGEDPPPSLTAMAGR